MAEYIGKITLINVADGATGASGSGIQSSIVYYATSNSNIAPPALVDASLEINNEIISFSDISTTFQIQNGILYAVQNDVLIPLSIDDDTDGSILIGLEGGWSTTIPDTSTGKYLWTKTVFTFTNGDQTITYNVAQNGQDGQDGTTLYTWFKYADDDQGSNMSDSPVDKKYMGVAYNKVTEEESNNPTDYIWSLIQGADGEKGQDAEVYRIETNQEEILRFMSAETYESGEPKISISPEALEIQINKREANGSTAVMNGLSTSNLALSIYDKGIWKSFEYTAILDDLGQKISIDLSDQTEIQEGQEATGQHYLKTVSDTVLKIAYQYEDYALTKYISIRYGMSKDQATLNVYSTGIVQSIQETKLQFDANGLTVQNGGIKILNNEEKVVLSADDDGNLIITGTIHATNGSFSGEINANKGSFAGTIMADSGTIGGFVIEEGELASTDENKSIILKGAEGIIEANNIILGVGAKIQDYIELAIFNSEDLESEVQKVGNSVKIIAPKKDDPSFLVVRDSSNNKVIDMTSEGQIFLGANNNKIILNGVDGTIKTQSFIDSAGASGWSISTEDSFFNNIIVRGSIKAATLEYGEIQAVGGILMIRPSSIIKQAVSQGNNTFILTLESIVGFRVGDICLVTNNGEDSNISKYYFEIQNINTKQEDDKQVKQITVQQVYLNSTGITPQSETANSESEAGQTLASTITGQAVVCLGLPAPDETDPQKEQNNIGIGINASENEALLKPQSISVFEFVESEKTGYEFTPHIILGKLPKDPTTYGPAAGTYGLYAENVLLKGSLVTETTNDSTIIYSGINTIYSGENRPTSEKLWNLLKDTDKTFQPDDILMWAGALGTSKDNIEASRFFVDRNGYLYAGGGYFEGAIITKSVIKATEIQTAVITGTGAVYNEKNELISIPALRIQNVSEGIHFYKNVKIEDETSEIAIFKLDAELISANIPQIDFNGLIINQSGQISSSQITANQTLLESGVNFTYENIMTYNGFEFKKGDDALGSIKNVQGSILMSTSGDDIAVEMNTTEVNMKRNLQIDQGKEVFYGQVGHYKPAMQGEKIVGYDLYITE